MPKLKETALRDAAKADIRTFFKTEPMSPDASNQPTASTPSTTRKAEDSSKTAKASPKKPTRQDNKRSSSSAGDNKEKTPEESRDKRVQSVPSASANSAVQQQAQASPKSARGSKAARRTNAASKAEDDVHASHDKEAASHSSDGQEASGEKDEDHGNGMSYEEMREANIRRNNAILCALDLPKIPAAAAEKPKQHAKRKTGEKKASAMEDV